MKVLLVHNEYRERGGEAAVYERERRALLSAGVEIVEFRRDNAELDRQSRLEALTLPARTIWAWDTQRALRVLIERERPDLAHFTNTLPLISPAAYRTCQRAGVPVLQSLHNYRLACPAATFFRDGHVCEECPEHGLSRAVLHACYRGSRAASSAVAAMLWTHRALGTYAREVDAYVALSEFARAKLIETAGLPAQRVLVKPNFLDRDPGPGSSAREGVVFAGRLVDYKGITVLFDALGRAPLEFPCKILGSGPLERELRARAGALGPKLELLGARPHDETLAQLKRARALVFPSLTYEVSPLAVIEAFACGLPVIASRLGALPEIVEDGETGFLFSAGDARELRAKLDFALANPARLAAMGEKARARFERSYTFEVGRRQLLEVYEQVLRARARR